MPYQGMICLFSPLCYTTGSSISFCHPTVTIRTAVSIGVHRVAEKGGQVGGDNDAMCEARRKSFTTN